MASSSSLSSLSSAKKKQPTPKAEPKKKKEPAVVTSNSGGGGGGGEGKTVSSSSSSKPKRKATEPSTAPISDRQCVNCGGYSPPGYTDNHCGSCNGVLCHRPQYGPVDGNCGTICEVCSDLFCGNCTAEGPNVGAGSYESCKEHQEDIDVTNHEKEKEKKENRQLKSMESLALPGLIEKTNRSIFEEIPRLRRYADWFDIHVCYRIKEPWRAVVVDKKEADKHGAGYVVWYGLDEEDKTLIYCDGEEGQQLAIVLRGKTITAVGVYESRAGDSCTMWRIYSNKLEQPNANYDKQEEEEEEEEEDDDEEDKKECSICHKMVGGGTWLRCAVFECKYFCVDHVDVSRSRYPMRANLKLGAPLVCSLKCSLIINDEELNMRNLQKNAANGDCESCGDRRGLEFATKCTNYGECGTILCSKCNASCRKSGNWTCYECAPASTKKSKTDLD